MNRYILLPGVLLFTFQAWSQKQGPVYQPMSNITVTAYGKVQSMPFCGGLNNPQFSMGDLNNDGKPDLAVFENGLGVKTFINEGIVNGSPKYVYAPAYEHNFPGCSTYMLLTDYNNDHIPDLFTQQYLAGFGVYKGYYNTKNELCFTYYTYLADRNDSSNGNYGFPYVNLNTDIPAIVDVNNDGALDLLAFDVLGKTVVEYKNISKIGGYPADSIVVDVKDNCWGKFYQGFWRGHVFGYDCTQDRYSTPPYDTFYNKVTHTGNTLCLFDYDGDGDYDYLDGSISFNEMTLCINGRVEKGIKGPDSMIAQDTLFPSNDKSVELPLQPAAFNIDIDQDGKKDLLIAPHSAGNSENYKCVWFYKNGTTPGHPSWTFESDTMLIDQMIDVGTAAYPAFFNYSKNANGLPDLFVGSDGYFQSSGLMLGKIARYINKSTPGNPSFELDTKDFLGISGEGLAGAAPAFGDLNNDGKTDMVVGHTNGTLSIYLNQAASESVQPKWELSGSLKDSAGNVIGTNSDHSAPFIYDLNKDGRPDLIIGSNTGYLQYYENHSTGGNKINLVLKTGKLGKIKVDSMTNIGTYSTPFIGRMDNTGMDYLLAGSNSGSLYRYTGFQNGSVPAYFPRIDSQYSYIDTTLSRYWSIYGFYNNMRSAPAVADIDGDGRYEMVVGEATGGLKIYEQTLLLGVPDILNPAYKVSAFPNPAKDIVTIKWEAGFALRDVTVTIYNELGQMVKEKTESKTQTETQLTLPDIPNGIYYCEIVSGNNRSTVQIAIVK